MGPHLVFLLRSSLVRADQHSVGRLTGGREYRQVRADAGPDVVLAHEALAIPGLIQRLGDGRGWHPDDLAHACEAQQVHTARVLSVLDPIKETLCAAGRYCFGTRSR